MGDNGVRISALPRCIQHIGNANQSAKATRQMNTKIIPQLEEKDKARFWVKIQRGRANKCWEWKAGTDECGYGKFRLLRSSYTAHRIVYQLTHGVIPEGMCVCHKCDNPPCCNPKHLWLGTFEENMLDKHRKKRGRCLRGELHYKARLSEKKVKVIRVLLKRGVSIVEIARRFGVGKSTIGCIKYNLSWKHLL